MNAEAAQLGLHESHFVNPNGLHDPEHYSSARDMAIIARALLRDFPEHAGLFGIGELQLGTQIIRNHNGLLGRYPGADGMKTGFTCPAGFNVVATANHYGRRLIAWCSAADGEICATRRRPTCSTAASPWAAGSGSLDSLPPFGFRRAPNMRADVCLRRSAAAIAGGGGKPWRAGEHLGRPRRRRHRGLGDRRRRTRPAPYFPTRGPLRAGAGVHRAGRRLERTGSRARATLRRRPRSGRRQGLYRGRPAGCDRRAPRRAGAERSAGAAKRGAHAAACDRATRTVHPRRSERRLGRKAAANGAKAVKTNAKSQAPR